MLDHWWIRIEGKFQIAPVLHLFYNCLCWVCSDAFRIRELRWKGGFSFGDAVLDLLCLSFSNFCGTCWLSRVLGLSVLKSSSRIRLKFALNATHLLCFLYIAPYTLLRGALSQNCAFNSYSEMLTLVL